MSLRNLATDDLGRILNDDIGGFAVAIEIIDPLGLSLPFKGLSTDIHQTIDPETGVTVSGRSASVSVFIRDLQVAGFQIPHRVMQEEERPWQVLFLDSSGAEHHFIVRESMPDRTIGCLVLTLEAYVV